MNLALLAASLLTLGTVFSPVQAADKPPAAQQWTLNMKDAELRDLVNEVGQITGKTMVLDPRLNGKVTVQSTTAMDQQGIYSLFLSALRSQGFAAMDQGDRVLILPVAEAKTKASASRSASSEEIVTQVVELHHAAANEVAVALRPLVATDAYLAPSTTANALVISDSANNVKRLREVIREIDSPGNKAFSTLQLRHAWAADVAKTLTDSLNQGGGAQQSAKAIGDSRSNQLILVGSAPVRQPTAAGIGNVYLQVGAFSQSANAQSLVSRINTQLGAEGAPPASVEQSNNLYRVKIGPYPDRQSALNAVPMVSDRIGILPSIASQ